MDEEVEDKEEDEEEGVDDEDVEEGMPRVAVNSA